jgi:biotin synthase
MKVIYRMVLNILEKAVDKIISGKEITRSEALKISEQAREQKDLFFLLAYANLLREEFKGKVIDLCSIINAKSGACPEDCIFCAQSSRYRTKIEKYPFIAQKKIVQGAKSARDTGADRFGIVISGRGIKGGKDLDKICDAITAIAQETDIGICTSLGTLTHEAAQKLKSAGLKRYHHNLETSEKYFPRVCTTHSYQERVDTLKVARNNGLSVCSGGIFGLGEEMRDRLELAFYLRELEVDSIPLNFLHPVPGTPAEHFSPLYPLEILKTIALFRFVLPDKDIRICGGKVVNLRGLQSLIYGAGANAVMIGNYLTTLGRDPKEDLQEIRDLGLVPGRSSVGETR